MRIVPQSTEIIEKTAAARVVYFQSLFAMFAHWQSEGICHKFGIIIT